MKSSKHILTAEQIDEYVQLTYLTKSEIKGILKELSKIAPEAIKANLSYRIPVAYIMEIFPQIKYNPFCERIFHVFSSMKDGNLSFEDVLDLCSAMSENCPLNVKANWAFKIFDFNEDKQISKEDIFHIIDKLTKPQLLMVDEKDHIADVILKEMDLSHCGGMNQLEFFHAITKMPEFAQLFSFKV